jgi:hypothetical protein
MQARSREDRRTRWFRIAVLALPALGALGVVVHFGVDVPMGDEWNTPGDQLEWALDRPLTLSDFTQQHNESRPAVAALAGALPARWFGWHPQLSMLLSLSCVLLTGALLHRMLAASATAGGQGALGAAFLVQLLLFSPIQLENQLWGIQLVMFVPGLCLVACWWLARSRRSTAIVFIGCALLALFATYSFSAGMIVWLLGCPAPLLWIRSQADAERSISARTLVGWSLVYLLCAGLVVGSYFDGFAATPGTSGLSEIWRSPVQFVSFLLAWMGLLYGAHAGGVPGSQAVGLLLFAAIAAALWAGVRRVRAGDGWPLVSLAYPWWMSIGYAVLVGIATSAGRASLGADAALASRYATVAIWVPIGLVGLATCLASARRPVTTSRMGWTALALGLGALAAWGWMTGLRAAPAHQAARQQAVITLRFIEAVPGDPMISRLSPWPRFVQKRASRLQAAGILPVLPVDSWFEEALTQPTTGDAEGEWSIRRSTRSLRIRGSARIPATGIAAAAVVLVAMGENESVIPVSVLAQRHDADDPRFSATLPIRTRVSTSRLAVYAIDLEGRALYRLPRETWRGDD